MTPGAKTIQIYLPTGDPRGIYETGRALLATLGYPIFEPLGKPAAAASAPGAPGASPTDAAKFFLTVGGVDGRMLYTTDGFVVLKGSRGAKKGLGPTGNKFDRARHKLATAGVLRVEGEAVFFDKDHAFTSHSTAAEAILGRASNGWKEWKTKGGATLDEVARPAPPPAG